MPHIFWRGFNKELIDWLSRIQPCLALPLQPSTYIGNYLPCTSHLRLGYLLLPSLER